MDNYYKILGLNSSASADEIRRAYRVLARRYHPDLNASAGAGARFKKISEAHNVLRDPKKRRAYDLELEQRERRTASDRLKAYEKAERIFRARREEAKVASSEKAIPAKPDERPTVSLSLEELKGLFSRFSKLIMKGDTTKSREASTQRTISQVSIIEVSLTLFDAISGVKKTIEVLEHGSPRKLSVNVPAGVRTGSVIRMRNRHRLDEEIVLVIQVARHPFLRLERRGLIVELPITINEALEGTSISVPTLDDPVMLRIPPSTQSGQYLRVRGRGLKGRDGTPGDLFYQVFIQVPAYPKAPGLPEMSKSIEKYYERSVRNPLPAQLLKDHDA